MNWSRNEQQAVYERSITEDVRLYGLGMTCTSKQEVDI